MEEKTMELIEKLAINLGTTAEHLWESLIYQALIYSIAETLLIIVFILIGIVWTNVVNKEFPKRKNAITEEEKKEEWDEDSLSMALGSVYIGWIILVIAIVVDSTTILTGFINPEYWALQQLIH